MITFAYDADGNRVSKTVTSGGAFPTTTKVIDVYQSGQLVSESDGSGTLLATFTYDVNGTPSSVQAGSDLTTAPRYYYSYNGHGDVVALTDATGTTVATYSYDTFGTPRSGRASPTGGTILSSMMGGMEHGMQGVDWRCREGV